MAEKTYSDTTTTVAQLREHMAAFVAERDWQQYHNPKNLSMSIAIEAAELMEKFQFLSPEQAHEAIKVNKEEIAQELADVMAYVFSFANQCDIDIAKEFGNKMILNAKKYPIEQTKGNAKKYTHLKRNS